MIFKILMDTEDSVTVETDLWDGPALEALNREGDRAFDQGPLLEWVIDTDKSGSEGGRRIVLFRSAAVRRSI